jgi:hypothetical protein
MRRRNFAIILLVLFTALASYAQTASEVKVPAFDDKYSKYVGQLEAGKTDIDYQDFRFSFIESEQFKIANGKTREHDSLTKEMYAQMGKSNYAEIIRITKQMLSIDYTDMMTHKVLRQTYKAMGDTVNAAKYKTIQFGLLYSIIRNGDGKSCETAWPVIQVTEEYFILEMIDAKLQKQTLDESGPCDKMEVKEDGKKKTYYFGISKVFEGYNKMGLH